MAEERQREMSVKTFHRLTKKDDAKVHVLKTKITYKSNNLC